MGVLETHLAGVGSCSRRASSRCCRRRQLFPAGGVPSLLVALLRLGERGTRTPEEAFFRAEGRLPRTPRCAWVLRISCPSPAPHCDPMDHKIRSIARETIEVETVNYEACAPEFVDALQRFLRRQGISLLDYPHAVVRGYGNHRKSLLSWRSHPSSAVSQVPLTSATWSCCLFTATCSPGSGMGGELSMILSRRRSGSTSCTSPLVSCH